MKDLKKDLEISIDRIINLIQESCECGKVRSYNILEDILYDYEIEQIILESAVEINKHL